MSWPFTYGKVGLNTPQIEVIKEKKVNTQAYLEILVVGKKIHKQYAPTARPWYQQMMFSNSVEFLML